MSNADEHDLAWCCMGAINEGPDGCTCWEPVYQDGQQEPDTDAPIPTREHRCPTCAYRRDSPEQMRDYPVPGPEQPFHCHKGMRLIVGYRHPSGAYRPAELIDGIPMEYDPPTIARVPYLLDGTPAPICAGWAAKHRQETNA